MNNKYSKEYLFRLNKREDILKWITELKLFVFERAVGGHANDPDELSTAVIYESITELVDISEKLKIDLSNLDSEKRKQIESKKMKSNVFLGHQIILGYRWGITISSKAIIISALNSKPYEVSNEDYKASKLFEDLIEESDLKEKIPVDALKERPRTITFNLYQEYF